MPVDRSVAEDASLFSMDPAQQLHKQDAKQ